MSVCITLTKRIFSSVVNVRAVLLGEFSLEIAYIVNEWPKGREEPQNSRLLLRTVFAYSI